MPERVDFEEMQDPLAGKDKRTEISRRRLCVPVSWKTEKKKVPRDGGPQEKPPHHKKTLKKMQRLFAGTQ